MDAFIEDKMKGSQLRWFGQRRPTDLPVRRTDKIIVGGALRTSGKLRELGWRQLRWI